jgi:hypothetical protein
MELGFPKSIPRNIYKHESILRFNYFTKIGIDIIRIQLYIQLAGYALIHHKK